MCGIDGSTGHSGPRTDTHSRLESQESSLASQGPQDSAGQDPSVAMVRTAEQMINVLSRGP